MAAKKRKAGSLFAKEATGGEIAEHGFSLQAGVLLARLPVWLAQSGFTQLIREALGDAEARFFVPGRGECLEFGECKDHRLTPSEFWPEIDRFRELELAQPGAYRAFRLTCTDVSKELRPICRALDRARRALPFYDGVSAIQDEAFEEFAQLVVCGGERDRSLAEFLFRKVEIDFEAPRRPELALASFRDCLERHIPEASELSGAQIKGIQASLSALLASRVAQPVLRRELVAALRSEVPEIDFAGLERTRIFTSSEAVSGWETRPDLVLDWAHLCGGEARAYPKAEIWRDELGVLHRTRDWVQSSGSPKTIRLSGTRRLSASVAIGATFSATAGFVIEVENRGSLLRTDDHAGPKTPDYEWRHEAGKGDPSKEIGIVVSVKREIADDVQAYLAGAWPVALVIHGSAAMVSADHMNLAVERTKELISAAVRKTGARVVHLFLAVPGAFALFLGHRLNATCVIQCYEHSGGATYVPSFRLSCT